MSKEEHRIRWKGKWVTQKVYNKRKQWVERFKTAKKDPFALKNVGLYDTTIEGERKIRNASVVLSGNDTKEIIRLPEIETVYYENPNDENSELEPEEDSPLESKIVEGRRIVDLDELGKRLWCGTCKEALSLSNIERESRRGLGSLFLVRCHKCLIVNEVITGKMHAVNTDSRATRFDINTDLALGILNTGVSLGMINKVHNYLKLPLVRHSTYRNYQEEIGKEEVAAIKARRNKAGHGPVLEEEDEES